MCDLPKMFRASTPTAQKEYRCCECSAVIGIGAEHQFCTGLWSEGWSTFRTCSECADLRYEVDQSFEAEDCGIPFGYLHQFIGDFMPDAHVWLRIRELNLEQKKNRDESSEIDRAS